MVIALWFQHAMRIKSVWKFPRKPKKKKNLSCRLPRSQKLTDFSVPLVHIAVLHGKDHWTTSPILYILSINHANKLSSGNGAAYRSFLFWTSKFSAICQNIPPKKFLSNFQGTIIFPETLWGVNCLCHYFWYKDNLEHPLNCQIQKLK